jgi:hypothetical protein
LLYVSPTGTIYTDKYLYGNYSFDENNSAVIYTFSTSKNWQTLWSVKFKIKNILE